ncbi:hypothetical protein, partial [Psychrobacter celer]|uniref:hypothetical protein n=1 Tax=Psychrobacter celer TaxID=306572 RepID=UPI003FD502E3
KSSLVMNADGSIIITGSSIITQAEKENKVIGKDVLINPPGASAGGDREPYPENAGYMATYGEPDQGGGGLPGMNFNPSNPNQEWDPEVNEMMPKSNGGRNPSKQEVKKVIDMIDLSDDVYKNDSKGISGYPRLGKDEIRRLGLNSGLFNTEKDQSGFYAAMYKNEKNGGYAVAMRGTEISERNDIIADAAQGIGLSNAQYDKAYELAQELDKNSNINKSNMTITGHSLGGGLAATAGSITGYPTYTFNAAGVHKNTLNKYGITNAQTKHIQAYNTKNDPLNKAQDNRGKVMSGAGLLSPVGAIAGYTTGALPRAIGTRTAVPTDDNLKTGHNTSGMKKALQKRL